jgi:hypothetical protein
MNSPSREAMESKLRRDAKVEPEPQINQLSSGSRQAAVRQPPDYGATVSARRDAQDRRLAKSPITTWVVVNAFHVSRPILICVNLRSSAVEGFFFAV